MSVAKGRDWGEPAVVPADSIVCDSDAAARAAVSEWRRADRPLRPIVLREGDLARTLGGVGRAAAEGEGTLVRVDVGAVLVDGRLHWFVAHLVARRTWLRGRLVVLANAAFLGEWNVAPRAHPGDGRLELLDGDPPLGDRWTARRRLASGTHLPHPAITQRRVEAVQLEFARPTTIRLDGDAVGRARQLSVRVEPAALEVYV